MHLSAIEFIRHILAECDYLFKESSQNSYDDFLIDQRHSKAICRSLEIIGEASNKIHPDFKSKYPFIPWREMSDSEKNKMAIENEENAFIYEDHVAGENIIVDLF